MSEDREQFVTLCVLSAVSVNSVNLGSSMKIFEEPAPMTPITKKLTFIDDNEVNENPNNVEKDSLVEKKTNNCSTVDIDDNGEYVRNK